MKTPATRTWNPGTLMQTSGAYWASCALHAGVELNIFSLLCDSPMTAQELASTLACDLRGVKTLLCALAALELLEKQGEAYRANSAARQYLSTQSPDYFGHIILHHHHLVAAWANLAEAVKKGAPTRESSHRTANTEERGHFLLGMFNVASQQAKTIAASVDLSGRTRLLDLGGGPGTYAIHFCQNNPNLSATIYDLPGTRPFAERTVANFGLAQRIRFEAGDFLLDPLEDSHDVIWISQVLHALDDEESAGLLKKAAGALTRGGVLLVQEFLLNEALDGPQHPALFGCNMLVGTEKGKVYTEKELSALLYEAGAQKVSRLALDLPQGCVIISGQF